MPLRHDYQLEPGLATRSHSVSLNFGLSALPPTLLQRSLRLYLDGIPSCWMKSFRAYLPGLLSATKDTTRPPIALGTSRAQGFIAHCSHKNHCTVAGKIYIIYATVRTGQGDPS